MQIILTAVDFIYNWGRSNSLWPLVFGTSCCAIEMMSAADAKYEPGNPLANADGYVYSSNVNVVEEMVDMISASRSYQNNVEVMNTSKELMLATLKLGQ